jgi:hypothetical protein
MKPVDSGYTEMTFLSVRFITQGISACPGCCLTEGLKKTIGISRSDVKKRDREPSPVSF